MSDETSLLAAIWEQPHEDTPRLVFADWLDENGQPERAEFIRVQVASAQLSEWDDGYETLKARERELLTAHETEWRVNVPEQWAGSPFQRGFLRLNLAGLKFEQLIRLTLGQLQLAPLARYHYNLHSRDFDAFLTWPGTVVQELFAPRPPLPAGWRDRMVACERLRNVSEVAFIDDARGALTADEVRAILDTWANRHLTKLLVAAGVRDRRVGGADDGVFETAANHPGVARLRHLDFRKARPTVAGVRALVRSPHLGNLRELDLWLATIGDAGLIELARSPLLSGLQKLNLSTTDIGDAGVSALANAPATAHLRELYLIRNNIGPDGFRALARSPYLSGLKCLNVLDNPGSKDAKASAELRARFGHIAQFRA